MAKRAPAKDTDRYFEEIEVDETYSVDDARTITEADVANFAGVVGDFHRIHMSDPFAEEDTEFDGRIAHGNFIAAAVEALVSEMNPHSFSYGHDNVRFVEPVLPGDTLSVRREVVEKEDYDDDYGRIVYRYEAENQDGELVHVNDHTMLVQKRDE